MTKPESSGRRRALAPTLMVVLVLAMGCDANRSVEANGPASTESGSTKTPRSLVQLDEARIRRAGIELTVVSAAMNEPFVEAYGRVLDPIPIADALANLEAARAAAEAADSQLRRVEALARDGQNASARDAEVARAAAGRARADLSMTEARVVGLLGPELAHSPELAPMVHRLARLETALVRIDVPANAETPDPARGAELSVYPTSDVEVAARFLGRAPNSDAMLPGTGFLFLLNAPTPPIGTPIRARLRSAHDPVLGVSVPASALIHHEQGLFVFVAGDDGVFERRGVTAAITSRGDSFVQAGLAPGERVVVSGAAELLSQELLASDSEPRP